MTNSGTPVRLIQIILTSCLVLFIFSLGVVWHWPDQYLHLVMCDVGQGDAILLTHGFTQVLVDAGVKEDDVLHCLRHHIPFWDRQIEWIIPTHLDSDHIGGFAGVLERYSVQSTLLPKDTKQSADFERFDEAVLREQSEGKTVHSASIGTLIPIGMHVKLSVLYAPTETLLWDVKAVKAGRDLSPEESNNRSTVLSLEYGQVRILLTGDLEAPVEQALVARGMVTQHTILKVGHHGSKSSSSEVFLEKVRPEIGLISVGSKNKYGHPSSVILERMARIGAKHVLRTDQLGTVALTTDGRSVWWKENGEQKIIRPTVGGADSASQRAE